jgi:hypothetical protein
VISSSTTRVKEESHRAFPTNDELFEFATNALPDSGANDARTSFSS